MGTSHDAAYLDIGLDAKHKDHCSIIHNSFNSGVANQMSESGERCLALQPYPNSHWQCQQGRIREKTHF